MILQKLKTVALATLALSSLTTFKPAEAAPLFSQAEIDSNRFVAVASPYAGGSAHQLLIIEQVSNSRACWSEAGSSPTMVNPLLVQFDFTGICGRSVDSNGYSIRMGGEDLGWKYSLRVVKRNGELWLVGVPNLDRKQPELLIGRTGGLTNGFAKISLNPGWRMTRRTYNGSPVGHIYLTTDRSFSSAVAANSSQSPVLFPSTPKPSPSKPSVSLPVPQPERPTASRPTQPSKPVVGKPIFVPLPSTPKPTVNNRPTVTPPPSSSRPVNPGDYVVPTIEVSN